LRIEYLKKIKNISGIQTAPLPNETIADGEWNGTNSNVEKWYDSNYSQCCFNRSWWFNNKWNIVKINNNVTSVGNKTVLGLFVEGTNSITYKMLSAK
jgi:hypothetical protein